MTHVSKDGRCKTELEFVASLCFKHVLNIKKIEGMFLHAVKVLTLLKSLHMKLFRSEFTYRALLKLTGVNQLECCCDPIRIMNTLRVYQTTRVRRRNNAANDNDDE